MLIHIYAWLDNTAFLRDVEGYEWGKGRLRIGESASLDASGPGKRRAHRSSLMEMASLANCLTTHCCSHRHTTPPDSKRSALALTASLSKPLAITAHTPIDRNTSARATGTAKMGLSKSTRIMILLGIDSAFFLLELIVGYAVHSLALVADSFHMVWQFGCGWQELVLILV